jgi:hypothetical protein
LARLAAAAERLLKELARGAVLMEPTILVFVGGTAWPGWESEQPPGHGVSQAQSGRSPAGQTGRGGNVQEQPDLSG